MNDNEYDDKNIAELETALRRTRLHIPAEIEARILADATRELAAAKRARPTPWRRAAILLIMTGVAAAVVLAYLRNPGLTLAQVQDALAKQTWVHAKYDNGSERWTRLTDGATFWKEANGAASAMRPDGPSLWRQPGADFIWRNTFAAAATRAAATRPATRPSTRTAWDAVVAPYERAAADPNLPLPMQLFGSKMSVEKAMETVDGRRLIRFDVYGKNAVGQRRKITQVWADPESRLPVKVAEWQASYRGGGVGDKATLGTYDFPSDGPADIYDLGVPRHFPIRDLKRKPSPEVKALLAKIEAAQRKFPQRYRALSWPVKDNLGLVQLVWRDGPLLRRESYQPSKDHPLPDERSAERVLAWTQTQKPSRVSVYDGTTEYWRMAGKPGRFWFTGTKTTVGTVPMLILPAVAEYHYTHFYQWPSAYDWSNTDFVKDPDAPPGILVLEMVNGGARLRQWFDPAKDYIRVRVVDDNKRNGKWERVFSDQLRQIERFGDSWLGRQVVFDQYDSRVGEKPQYESVHQIDVQTVEAKDLPPDIFVGKKLLEGDVESF